MIEPAEVIEPNERPLVVGLEGGPALGERTETHLSAEAHGPARPLLRGRIHCAAAVGALAVLALMVGRLPLIPRPLERAAMVVYGASLVELYAISAAFHRCRWRGRAYRRMRLLDHASIFVVIAATATVFISLAPASEAGLGLIGLIWVMATAGIGLKLFHGSMSRGLGTGLYVVMGWIAGGAWLASGMASADLATLPPLALAGALYTAGALAYARRWPDLWPRVFGYHEVFHALVVMGNTVATLAVLHAAG